MNINNMSTVALKSTAVVTLAALTACTCTLTWKFSSVPNEVIKTLRNVNSAAKKAETAVDQINKLAQNVDNLVEELDRKKIGDVVENCAGITKETKLAAEHIRAQVRYIFSKDGVDSILTRLDNDDTFKKVFDVLSKLPRILSVLDNAVGGNINALQMRNKLDDIIKKYKINSPKLTDEAKSQLAERAVALEDAAGFGWKAGNALISVSLLAASFLGSTGKDSETAKKILEEECANIDEKTRDVIVKALTESLNQS